MELTVMIIALVVALLCVAALFAVLILNNRNKGNTSGESIKEITELKGQVESLSKEMKHTVTEEMLKVSQQNQANADAGGDKLRSFQKEITDSLNNRLDAMDQKVEKQLAAVNQQVEQKLADGFKNTSDTFAEVRERLKAIDDAQKNIENLGKDVVSLKQVLEGNQSRGQYGEYQLDMVLHQVFGDTNGCYQEQYTIKKGRDGNDVRADSVVFMPEPNKMICIDSKFPFKDYEKAFDCENKEEKEVHIKDFANAVKKHITAIKDKYIIDGKTAPEAMMFVPNDGVFAFIHQHCQDVVDYARESKVILTSPSTLPPILVTINMVRIEVERSKNAKEISKQLQRLGKDFEMFAREWNTFSSQLDTATKSRERLDQRVNKINNKFDAIKTNDTDLLDYSSDPGEIKTEE